MANNETQKKATPSTKKKTTVKSEKAEVEQAVKPDRIIPKEIDDSEYVNVRNGFQGTLVYISKRTGEEFVWDSFGDEQEMQLRELKNAKSSSKRFFTDNWFMFDEDWVVDYLGMRKYYKNALGVDSFDSIFSMSGDELRDTINNLSKGQRQSVVYRAKELITEGKIDSLSTINVLEDMLGIELIEK